MLLSLFFIILSTTSAHAQTSLFDPKYDELRKASEEWDRRLGPERKVIDLVCLVPDVATFLEAIKVWDREHYFPILIDDVEFSFKFLRAFRPARIVRFPGKAEPGDKNQFWKRARASVAKSWDGQKAGEITILRGDHVPEVLGPTPPGVVLSNPDSPSLAGAVALAAGRFQPLWNWDTSPKHFDDIISLSEAKELATSIDALLGKNELKFDKLGDDCDFLTLAGDYPYRYVEKGENNAFDDLIMRTPNGEKRTGYAGRLMGGSVESLYRAMCSLFLRPSSLVLFNTYADNEQPWSRFAALPVGRLNPSFIVKSRAGEGAGLSGWHQQFDPLNQAGLVLINSSGGAISFRIDAQGVQAHTSDIPESDPVAIHMIHSFSAEKPDDPDTLAGRWLANGAYVYYGSVNEPYLEAFRTPGLVATLLADKLPFSAACRKIPGEVFGQPWRLMLFGDPLFRVRSVRPEPVRVRDWEPVASWGAYPAMSGLNPDAPEIVRLGWSLRAAIHRLQQEVPPQSRLDPGTVLAGIDRARLDPKSQSVFDDLLFDTLLQAGRVPDLVDRMSRVPVVERSPTLRRHLETMQLALLQHAIGKSDVKRAIALWEGVVLAPELKNFVRTYTERVGKLAESANGITFWQAGLRKAIDSRFHPENKAILETEWRRIGK